MSALLDRPRHRPVGERVITPDHYGPTWDEDPDWDGQEPAERFILPKYSLGWQAAKWANDFVLDDEGNPWKFTPEQMRWWLWWYALDSLKDGVFVYRKGILQRLKGWGKDPLAAVLCLNEFAGPCRFSGVATQDYPELGVYEGEPLGTDNPRAWIQTAAVTITQTKNTMKLFPSMISPQLMALAGMTKRDIGKEKIHGFGGQRTIEAVTSSPRALEGARPTLIIANETHQWVAGNDGHAMHEVIERNLDKSKGGAARKLSITNAYDPAENSVAQREREAWEREQGEEVYDTGVFYDSLEAGKGIRLVPKFEDHQASDEEVREHLFAVLRGVRGDAKWLDLERIANSIMSLENPPSLSRRFWFNQKVAAEDSWLDDAAITAARHPDMPSVRRRGSGDPLRDGWALIPPADEIVMFFDGSKSDDATALVGCSLSDATLVTLGVWHGPKHAPKGRPAFRVPRYEVDMRVAEVMERFNVVAFWADPSHAKDDDPEGDRYWDPIIDSWHRQYKDDLQLWPVKTGAGQHSIMWDMASQERQRQFTAAAEEFVLAMMHQDDIEEYEPEFWHDGHPRLEEHLANAKNYPTKFGTSLWKGARDSPNKIDLAVCAVGARMLRRLVLNVGLDEPETPAGTLWGRW